MRYLQVHRLQLTPSGTSFPEGQVRSERKQTEPNVRTMTWTSVWCDQPGVYDWIPKTLAWMDIMLALEGTEVIWCGLSSCVLNISSPILHYLYSDCLLQVGDQNIIICPSARHPHSASCGAQVRPFCTFIPASLLPGILHTSLCE